MSEGTWEKLAQVTVKGAEHDSHERLPHPQCLEGTRVVLLNHIYGMLDDKSKSRLIWLHGTAGVGKSAVAFTVAERMRGLKVTEETNVEKRLAGTFFFSRKHTNRRTTGYLFATLAYQLASNFPSVKTHVNTAILENPALLHPDGSLRKQMEALFSRPLRQLKSRLRDCPPLAFVIDALDECTESLDQSTIEPFDENKSEIELAELISLLTQALRDPDLPVTHILVTSRSGAHIHEAMQHKDVRPLVCEIPVKISGQGVATTISLDGTDVDGDIYLFLQHSFSKLRSRFSTFPQPTQVQLERLVNRAGRRFIVASTMMKFIDDRYNDPYDRLELLLELANDLLPGTEVYKLYDCILSTCADPTQAYLHLSVVAALADPLPISHISKLLGPGQGGDVEGVLVQLRSVIDVPTDNSLPVNIYHSSVRDYVSHRSNCSLPQVKYITSPHSLLALSSLYLMAREIPESTALLDVLSQLNRQSQAIKSHDLQSLKHLSSFMVQPPESLQVLIGLLWLRGHRSSELQFWLETLDGRAWLQTEAKDWLLTRGGQDWLLTQRGQDWLLTDGGTQWLLTHWGKARLQSRAGRAWLRTEGGQSWLQKGGKIWLRTRGGQSWLETEDGRVWLKTEGVQSWLETEGGQDWLLTGRGTRWLLTRWGMDWLQSPGGQVWLQTKGGQSWLQTGDKQTKLLTKGGKIWLQTESGKDWLQTMGGKDWLQTTGGKYWLQNEGRVWLQVEGGRVWLQTKDGQYWLRNQHGRAWLRTEGGQSWLQAEGGQDWLQTKHGRRWLETNGVRDWLHTKGGQDWLQTRCGLHWLQTQCGRRWLLTLGGRIWLQYHSLQSVSASQLLLPSLTQQHSPTLCQQSTLPPPQSSSPSPPESSSPSPPQSSSPSPPQSSSPSPLSSADLVQTWDESWLQIHGVRDLQEEQDWLQTQTGRYWLQTQAGCHWLQTQAGQDWLQAHAARKCLQTLGGRDWPQTRNGGSWLLTSHGRYWLQTQSGEKWLQTHGGQNWLQTQCGQDWLQILGGEDWLQAEGGRDWLQAEGGRKWLQADGGRKWLQTEGGRHWLQNQSGRDWLQTPHGQAWRLTTIWVTMEEFSSTLNALKENIIAPDMHLHPAFQVIQQFKDLPDFLMLPAFLALRHQDHSPSTSPHGRLPPDIEIIRAMKIFLSFAYEAREESQSASDTLNYACQNWVVHLSQAPNPWDERLSHIFQSFWDRILLSWLARQWCSKGLQSCLTILSEGEKIARQHLQTSGSSQ